MQKTRSKIEGVDLSMQIEDSRLKITGRDVKGDLYVNGEDVQPVSVKGTVATITLTGEDMVAEVDLDSRDLDALADAIHHLQEAMRDA